MRNLKKFLCLALALTMALSLIVLPTAQAVNLTDFSDASGVKDENKEAVDVLVAIGMVKGDDGKIDPEGRYTRAQAAALMARYMLGSTLADSQPKVACFDDLDESNYWAWGYINYCKSQGIINGLGDGTFNPGGDISASAMLKMLLVATGYGKNDEYVGGSWEINAIKDAVSVGIVSRSTSDDLTLPAARQTIFKYTFTTLAWVEKVDYNQFLGYVRQGAGFSALVQEREVTPTFQRMEVFRLEPVYDQITTGADTGLSGRRWAQRGTALTLAQELYVNATPVGEPFLGSSKTYAQLASGYSWQTPTNTNPTPRVALIRNGRNITATVNGATVNALTVDSLTKDTAWNSPTLYGPFQAIFGSHAGLDLGDALIQPYDTNGDGIVDTLVAKNEFLAKVTALGFTAGTVTATVYVKAGDSGFGVEATEITGQTVTISGAAVGSYLWVVPELRANSVGGTVNATWRAGGAATGAVTILEAGIITPEEAQIVGSNTTNKTITTNGGKTLTLASLAFKNGDAVIANSGNFGSDTTLYIGKSGRLLGFDPKAASNPAALDYLLLTDLDLRSARATVAGQAVSTQNSAKARITRTDGTFGWVDLALNGEDIVGLPKLNGDNEPVADSVAAGTRQKLSNTAIVTRFGDGEDAYNTFKARYVTPGWYSYSVNSNGQYTLKTVNTDFCKTGTTVAYQTTSPTVTIPGTTGLLADSATKLTIVNTDGGTTRVFTGYKNFTVQPTTTDKNGNPVTNKILVVRGATAASGGGYIANSNVAFIYVISGADAASETVVHAFIAAATGNVRAGDEKEYTVYYHDGDKYVSGNVWSTETFAAGSIAVINDGKLETVDPGADDSGKIQSASGVVSGVSANASGGWITVQAENKTGSVTDGFGVVTFVLAFENDNPLIITNSFGSPLAAGMSAFNSYYTTTGGSPLKVGDPVTFWYTSATDRAAKDATASGSPTVSIDTTVAVARTDITTVALPTGKAPNPATPITSVSFTLNRPTAGAALVSVSDTDQYTAVTTWFGGTGNPYASQPVQTTPFASDDTPGVRVVLTAKEGFVFDIGQMDYVAHTAPEGVTVTASGVDTTQFGGNVPFYSTSADGATYTIEIMYTVVP